MRILYRMLLLAVVVCGASGTARGASFTWTGAVSSDWFNTNNWTPPGVPGGSDTAIISSGAPVAGKLTNVGTVNLSGGTLNASAGLIISNAFNWTGGVVAGTWTISSNATLDLNRPGNVLDLPGATLINNGTAVWNGGQIRGNGATIFTNNGSWLAQTDDQVNNAYGGTPNFYNNGVLTKSPTTGTTGFYGITFNNTGTVNVQSGTLNLGGGGIFDGNFQAAAGTALNFSGGGYFDGTNTAAAGANIYLSGGTFTYGPDVIFTGGGNSSMTGGSLMLTNNTIPNLALNGGTITLGPNFQGGSITNLPMSGGTLSGTNTVTGTFNFSGTVSGGLTIAAGASCYLTNYYMNGGLLTVAPSAVLNLVSSNLKDFPNSTFVNNGTVNWDGGQIRGNGATIFTNNGSWLALTDDQMNNAYGGTPNFYNNGVLTKSPATGTTAFNGVAFNNTGTVNVQSGTLNLGGGGIFDGNFQAGTNTALNFSAGGYFDGTNTAAAGANIYLSGGTFTYGPDAVFTGAGNSSMTGGSLTLTNSTIPNVPIYGGTITLGPNFQGGSITNLTMVGGTLSGTYTVTGTFNFSGTVSGGLTIAAGASCYVTNLTMNGGLLTVAPNAVLNLVSSNVKDFPNSTFVNNGTVMWNGGQIRGNGGTIFTNNGSWLALTDDEMNNAYGGTPNFYNIGVFTKSPTTGTTAFNGVAFNNTGTVNVQGGTLTLGGGGYFDGTNTAAAGANIYLSGGSFTDGPDVIFNGAGQDIFTGGTLTLTDDVIPNLPLDGGTVVLAPTFQGGSITNLTLNGSALSGAYTVTGTLNWLAGSLVGALNIAASGTLNISGSIDVHQYAALTNAGHILWNGSANWQLINDNGATHGSINNLAGGVIDVQCNQSISQYYGNEFVTNAGLFRKSLSTGTTSVGVSFYNTGTVSALSGTINFGYGIFGGSMAAANGTAINLGNGGVLGGSFTAGFGANINLTGGTFTQVPPFSLAGAGSYAMTGGTLTLISNTIPNLQMSGGTIALSTNFQGGIITNLTLNGPSLAGSNVVSGTLTINGSINGSLTVLSNATLNWIGNVNGALTLNPGATANWSGGTIYTPLTIPTNVVLTLAGSGNKGMQNWMTNAGTINWTGGTWQFIANFGLYNQTGALINIQCDQNLNWYWGGEFINNAGTLRKSATVGAANTGTTYISPQIYNTGTVDLESGNLTFYDSVYNSSGIYQGAAGTVMNFNGGGVLSGPYTMAAGSTLYLSSGTFTITPPLLFNGAGNYLMTGGTLTLLTNPIPNLQMSGGTIALSTNFQGGTITNLTLYGPGLAGSNVLSGTLTLTGTIIGPLTVLSNATLNWNGNVNSALTLNPGATANWSGGTIYTPFTVPSNVVLTLAGSGNKGMQNWMTNAGTINWTAGTWQFIANYGLYNLAGATINIQCDQNLNWYWGGEFINNAGLFRKWGTTGTTYISPQIYNTGSVDLESGNLTFYDSVYNSSGIYQGAAGTVMNFNGGGVLSGPYTMAAGSTLYLSGGTFTITPPLLFNGAGNYLMTGGTLTLLTNPIPNLQMSGGTIALSTNFQGGTITNLTLNGQSLAGSNVVSGTLNLNGSITGPLTVLSNATLNWNGNVNGALTLNPGATANWSGGTIYTPLTIPTNVVLTLAGSGNKGMQNWMTNAGTINWTGGTWQFIQNYGLYNQTGATINIQCDQTLNWYWGGEFINNAGLFRKWGATGASTIYPQYIGTGVVDAESGTLNFNNAFSQTGGAWAIGIDGLGSSGHIGLSGAATLAAALNVNLDNNYVLGLSNSFNIISYSSHSGTFSTTNLPTDGASWQLNYGASAVTLLITNLLTPAIAITTPTNNQAFVIPVNIPISTSVTDTNAAIAAVQFYQGTNLIGQALGSPYNFTWNSVPPGLYTFSAWAIDAAGAVATSAPVNVTVYSNQAQATNYTWTGAVSSDWFTPGNWNPNGVPGVLDNVTIASGGTVNVGGSATVNNINFSSGTLQGPGVLSAANTFTWTGGAFTGLLTVPANGALNINGSVNLSGATLLNLGTILWTGGSLSGNAGTVITNSGLWLAEAGNQINLNGGSIYNNGIFRTLNNGGGTSLYNLSFVNNSTVDAQSGPVYFQSGGTLAGTYNTAPGSYIYFSGGAFTLGALPAFTGSGTSELNGGTLTILNNPAPGLLLVGGTVVLNPSFQGGSITNLTIAGSTLAGTNTVTGTFNWTGGSLNGQLTVAPSGVLNLSGSDKSLSGSALINSGQVNWTGGGLYGDSTSVVTNNNLWLAQCDYQINFGNGAAAFVNNGILRKSVTTGTTTIASLAFVNNGTLDAQSGSFNLNSGGTLSGTYHTAPGADINFNGGSFTFNAFPAITGGGTTRLTGGTLTVASDLAPGLLLEGGTVVLGAAFQNGGAINNLTNLGATLSGNYTVTGAYTWAAGSLSGSLTVATNAVLNLVSGGNLNFPASALTNFGTVFWNGAPLVGYNGTWFVNNGLWLEESDDQIYNNGGSVTFINNSTFRKQGAYGTTTFNGSVAFQNNGFVDVETGAVSFAGGGALGGSYYVAQFASLNLSGGGFSAGAPPLFGGAGVSQLTGGTLTLLADQIPNLVLAGGNLVLGPAFQNSGAITNLTLSGATLTGSNTLTGTLNWNAGGLNSSWLTVATNAVLNLATGSDKNMPGSVLINNGTVVWTGGAIRGNGSTAITNNSLWLVQNDYQMNNAYGGTPSFVNNGVFSKSVTYGGTVFNNVSVLNSGGTFDIESGYINFINSASYAQTGAILDFGLSGPNLAGQLFLPGHVNLDGTLGVSLHNGYTPAAGDVIALISYGSESGVFATANLPPLAGGVNWDLNYGPTSVTLQAVAPPVVANPLQISGLVTDNNNHPISGVTVFATMAGVSNLVQNGSFEIPSIGTTAYTFYGLGSTNISNWTVVGRAGANVALTSLYWAGPAEDGSQFFDPTGNTGGGGITQTFPTTPGATYDLIFYHGTYSQHGRNSVLGVTIDTNYYTFGETSGGYGNFDWRRVQIQFTASTSLTPLTFLDLNGNDANNNFVDNVQVIIPGEGAILQAVTGADGSYQIPVPNQSFQVGVTGLPAAGYNTVAPQTVAMNGSNQTVNFITTPVAGAQLFTITTAANPAGGGSVSSGGTYQQGATALVTATPNTATLPYSFSGWTENGVLQSINAAYSFTVNRNRNLVANFALPLYTITASNNPAAAGSILGAGTYIYGQTCVLTAYPNFGYSFTNWTEGATIVGTNLSLTNVVFAGHSFVANYTEANVTHVVTTATSPPGVAAVAGAGTYANGQTANFSAPLAVTNPPYYYQFQQFTLSNTLASASAAFAKTFSTLDPTNLQYVAVYSQFNILPQVTNITANYAGTVPATTNFLLTLQFDRGMAANISPIILLTNSAVVPQATVATNGYWTTNALNNDTYHTPPITFASGMDGTVQLFVSGAQDANGDFMVATNPAHFVVDATPPPNPMLAVAASNSSSVTVSWAGYAAPPDLAGFRVYIQGANFTSVAGLPVLTGLGSGARSFQFSGLALDTPYYVAVQALDTVGNSLAAVSTLAISIPSTLPPPVAVQESAVGDSSALLSWSGYNTSGLLGFAGFLVYYEQTNFTTVAGLNSRATLGPAAASFQVNSLNRANSYYFAVVGFNALNNFNPAAATANWSDPYAGNISVNTTIGGPGRNAVNIYQSMTVVSNATLTILPGTTLLFAPGAGLTVQQGALAARGAALAPIILDSANDSPGLTPAPGDWAGLTLGSGAGGSSLNFVEILYGRGLTLNACAPSVQAFTANFNSTGLALENGSSLTTSDALISGNGIGLEQFDTALLAIQNSVIQNNQTNAFAAGSLPMTATGNWWGTADQAGVGALLAGNVTFNPFLNYEPLLTPALGASNGVTQVGTQSASLQLACRTAASMRLSEDFSFNGVFFVPFTNFATFPLSAGGGLKHIFAQYRSITGQTNAPLELDVTYVTAGPVIQSFSLSDGQVLNRPLTVTGSATAALGVQDIEFYLDSVLQTTNAGGSLSWFFDIRPLNNAIHQVELLARDTAGNIATLTEDVIVAVTPPPAPVITAPAGDYVTNNATLAVAGTAEPGISLQISAGSQFLGTVTADAQGHFTLANATLAEGVNTIVAVASDSTGSASSAARHITVETIPPAAVVLNQPVYIPGAGLNLTWNYAPTGKQAATFEMFWSLSSFATTNLATGHSIMLGLASYTFQGLAPGTYYFGVVGFDAAGNPSPLSALVSALYDPTAPALSIAYNQPSPVGAGPVGITLISSKALAGIPSLALRPNGAASPVLLSLTNVALNTYQTAFVVASTTPSGLVAVLAGAQDQVGNTFNGAPSGAPLTIDTTPPAGTIATVPAGPVQTVSNTSVTVGVTLTKPAAAATTPTLSFTPPTGSVVPVTLAGAGMNWSGALALTPGMGSGFGRFALSAQDSVGNVGTNILSGGRLELYNTALPSPPAAPTNLAAASLAGGGIRLSWNSVSNAQIYRLYREPGTNFLAPYTLDLDGITSNYAVDLPPGDGLYIYGISASRLGSESAISNVVIATSDSTPPAAPTNVTVSLAPSGVRVAWQEPSGGETPDHYNVYRNGALIQSASAAGPVIDYPPRGTNTYIVSAVDAVGNENPSAPASIQLLVSPVNNLSVLSVLGQAPVLSWTTNDPTVAGFNVYRNGIKQNSALLTATNYTDNLPMSEAITYGVTAVNGSAQEGPQRIVTVNPVALGLLANPAGTGTSHPLLTGYFDQFQAGITNLSGTAGLTLAGLIWNRTVPGASPLSVTQNLAAIVSPGGNVQQSVIVAEAPVVAAQAIQVSAVQQTDSEGSSVTYQGAFVLTNSQLPGTEVSISANQLPLAGGLTPFQVQVFNRSYVNMQFIVERASGSQPGDVYISVQNSLGQEVSRTPYQGAPPGTTFLADGTAYVNIAPGSSVQFTVPNVLTPAALAGTGNVTFQVVVGTNYSQIGTPSQLTSGPLFGSTVSGLAQTPYYGTAQTDKPFYTNGDSVIISGQAITRATGLPLPNAALNIGFATRGYRWYIPVTTDASGNYQYTYNAPPGFGGSLSLWAANPLVVDQLNEAQIILYRVYATPSAGDIQMSKNGTLNFSIQLFNPGDVPLTAFASSFKAYQVSGTNLTPLALITGTNLSGSGFDLEPNQRQTINLELAAAAAAPNSAEVIFTFASSEGASATFTATVNLSPAVPVLAVVQPAAGYLEVSADRGGQVSGHIVIANNGLADLRGVSLLPPTNSWISVNLPVSAGGSIALPDLPIGQSNTFSVVFSPPSGLPLAFYQDTVTIQAANLSTPFQISVAAIVTSALTGGVQFYVDDILGEALSGAAVRLNNSLISANAGPFYTDTNGLVTVSNLVEGTWSWQASAPGCSASSGTVDIKANQTGYQHARLNRSLVTVNFSVVPVPFSDSYTVQITQTYQTHVPMPVLVASPLLEEFHNVSPGFQASYNVTVQNQGLAQMENVTLGSFQNGAVSYQPLISYIPVVLPQQSIDVPYTVTYWGTNAPAPQGGNAGCLSALAQYFTGSSFALSDWAASITQDLMVADSILQAEGHCPTDNSYVALGAQAAANLYATAEGMGFASPANQAAAMAAYMECLLGGVESGPFSNGNGNGSSGNYTQAPNPQQSGTGFQTTGGGCLAGDTRILMADGTGKLISEIAANDLVRSGVRADNITRVAQVYTVDDARVYELRLRHPGGQAVSSVVTSQEHLFWVDGKGWIPATELKPGDWLCDPRGARIEIAENRPLDRHMKVYTLRLEMDNAFYANDVLVHDLCGGSLPVTAISTPEAIK